MARQRGSKWQADVRTPDGPRLRPAFDTKALAEAWEAAANLAIEQGKPIPPTSTGKVGNRSLATLGSLFDHVSRTEWAQARASANLIRNGKAAVSHFGTGRSPASITSAEIAEYRVKLAEGGNSLATVNRKCAALSKMLSVALDAGAIEKKPKIKMTKEVQTKFRFLDDLEERALLAYWAAAGQPDMADLTVLLIDTGARCFSEMVPARWDAYSKGYTSVTFWATKTGQPRTIPLTKRCRYILERRRKTHADRSGPFLGVSKDGMRSRWDAMRATLGFADVTPHTMRHTCCTRLVMAGVDVKRVMTWMGHTVVTTTMRYMQIRPTALEDLVSILEGGRLAGSQRVEPVERFAEAA
jgi:integrase